MSRRDKLSRVRESGSQLLPSMLLCNFGNLEKEVRQLEEAGIQVLHLDVMDGDFVPNFTYGMTIVEALRGLTELVLDVHLMISQPERYVEAFYEAGADVITFHAEASEDPIPLLKKIRGLGAASGLAFNPATTVESIEKSIPHCDLALAMSIQPGFGGQKLQDNVLPKFEELKQLGGAELILEIDGGVNSATIDRCVAAGVEWFVAGSAIFRQADYSQAIHELNSSLKIEQTR